MAFRAPATTPNYRAPVGAPPTQPPLIQTGGVNIPGYDSSAANAYQQAYRNALQQIRDYQGDLSGSYDSALGTLENDYVPEIMQGYSSAQDRIGSDYDALLGRLNGSMPDLGMYDSGLLQNMAQVFQQDLLNPEYNTALGLLRDVSGGNLRSNMEEIGDRFAGTDMPRFSGIRSAQEDAARWSEAENLANTSREAMLGIQSAGRRNALDLETLRAEIFNNAQSNEIAALDNLFNAIGAAYAANAGAQASLYGSNVQGLNSAYNTRTQGASNLFNAEAGALSNLAGTQSNILGQSGAFLGGEGERRNQFNLNTYEAKRAERDYLNNAAMSNYQRNQQFVNDRLLYDARRDAQNKIDAQYAAWDYPGNLRDQSAGRAPGIWNPYQYVGGVLQTGYTPPRRAMSGDAGASLRGLA